MDASLRFRLISIFTLLFTGMSIAMISEEEELSCKPLLIVAGIGVLTCYAIQNGVGVSMSYYHEATISRKTHTGLNGP